MKNPNPGKKFFWLGGGGGGGGEVKERWYRRNGQDSHPIFYTRHIVMTSSTEQYGFMKKIILTVFKIESIASYSR